MISLIQVNNFTHYLIFLFASFADIRAVVAEILNLDMSINLYMFHGGTNFGFMNGASAVDLPTPKAMITSYGT